MTVAAKLRAALALPIALMAVLLVYHVRTIRETVSAGYEVTDISSRAYSTASEQSTRITQLEENAAKFLVTRDTGYLLKFEELVGAFSAAHDDLKRQPLGDGERAAAAQLERQWQAVAEHARLLSAADSAIVLEQFQERIDTLRAYTRALSAASQEAMLAQLARNADAARRAERVSWIAAGLALIVSAIVSSMIVRSITDGLSRLAAGTREVARGRFGHRLDDRRSDEFAQLARDFNAMTVQLDELDRMKRDFVSKVSHDLKTPLASMQETIVALLDEVSGPLLPRQRRLLELNHQSSERLYGMLAKLLDLSRLESGALAPRLEDIDLGELLDEATEHHSGTGGRIDIAIPAPIVLHGDRDRVLQLVHNLVENALKFARDGVSISAALVESPGDAEPSVRQRIASADGCRLPAVHIVVSDDGPGIADEEKSLVFERFVQGAAGRAVKTRGVGLGLTICREIVVVHRGDIWIEDRIGGGTEFHVLLPEGRAMQRNDSAQHAASMVPTLAAIALLLTAGCATSSFDRHFAAGRLDEAATEFNADPSRHTNADALYRAGLIFASTGTSAHDPVLARDVFVRLVTMHPGSPHVPSALRFIELLDGIERERTERLVRERELVAGIARLESDRHVLESQIDAARRDLAVAESNTGVLRSRVAALEASLRSREDELALLRNELENLKAIDLRTGPRAGGIATPPD